MRVGMDGTRLASEYQAEAHLASRESPQDESSCLDSYDGGDVGRRERASKSGTDSSKKVGITQRVGEVGMAVGPPERSKEELLDPKALVHRQTITDAVIPSRRSCAPSAPTLRPNRRLSHELQASVQMLLVGHRSGWLVVGLPSFS